MCLRVPKKSAVLACLTMSKLKVNQHVPNISADLLKKISLIGTVRGRIGFWVQLKKNYFSHTLK